MRVTGQDKPMAIEHAFVQVVRKPWGVADLHPWSIADGSGDPVGELWVQRVYERGSELDEIAEVRT
jgi:mannose-6-phosphate isomerase